MTCVWPFFMALNKRIICLLDDDGAGSRLAKFGDKAFIAPEPFKDIGEMPQSDVNDFISSLDI